MGVYGDVKNAGPAGRSFPEIDVPFWQAPWPRTTMAVHTAGDVVGVQQGLANVIQTLEPDLPMANVRTIEQVVSEAMAADRFHTVLFGAFAAVALMLAAVGIYGVMSFVVSQRTQEIGVRMALGAARARVLREVLREGMTTALIGTILGAAGAWSHRPGDEGNDPRRGDVRSPRLRDRRGHAARLGSRGVPRARTPRRLGGPDRRAAPGLAGSVCSPKPAATFAGEPRLVLLQSRRTNRIIRMGRP